MVEMMATLLSCYTQGYMENNLRGQSSPVIVSAQTVFSPINKLEEKNETCSFKVPITNSANSWTAAVVKIMLQLWMTTGGVFRFFYHAHVTHIKIADHLGQTHSESGMVFLH